MVKIKLRRKSIIIIMSFTVVIILIGILYAKNNNLYIFNPNCQDIIGDGYDMGTDLKPVVIGNSCDYK